MAKGYVLIEVDDCQDEEVNSAGQLTSFLVNEFENWRILEGNIKGFDTLEELAPHVHHAQRGPRL